MWEWRGRRFEKPQISVKSYLKSPKQKQNCFYFEVHWNIEQSRYINILMVISITIFRNSWYRPSMLNRTIIIGHFQIRFQYILNSDLKKVPNLSNFGPIFSTSVPNQITWTTRAKSYLFIEASVMYGPVDHDYIAVSVDNTGDLDYLARTLITSDGRYRQFRVRYDIDFFL